MINLPTIRDYVWRSIRPTDGPLLEKFEQACALIDGATKLKSSDDWVRLANEEDIENRSLMATNAQGKIAIVGWFEIDERIEHVLAFLEGRVHPDFREHGYGTVLLDWLESNAALAMRKVANRRECIYRIMFYDRALDAFALFEKRGYALQYIEQEMLRDLRRPWPDFSHQELRFEPWTADNKFDFYDVYRAAFRTRSDNLMLADSWHHHFANPNDDDFQPDLSILARKSGSPAAYAVIHSEESSIGSSPQFAWITQTGVHSDYRRQGIGSALLTETMKELHSAGYPWVKLSVNVNNPGAISLYKYLGFTSVSSLTMYHRAPN